MSYLWLQGQRRSHSNDAILAATTHYKLEVQITTTLFNSFLKKRRVPGAMNARTKFETILPSQARVSEDGDALEEIREVKNPLENISQRLVHRVCFAGLTQHLRGTGDISCGVPELAAKTKGCSFYSFYMFLDKLNLPLCSNTSTTRTVPTNLIFHR